MAGIGGLVAVHTAGIDKAVGGLVCLQIADRAAREVGTQAELIPALALVMTGQPVGVHALPGGMVGGEVQVVEAIELAGNVVLLVYFKAHGAEGVVEIVAHLGNGVQAACGGQKAGNGDIEVRVNLGSLQLQVVSVLLDKLGELGLGLIHGLAHLRTQGHIQLGHFLQQCRQAALLAQNGGLDVLQLGFVLGCQDLLSALLEQSVQLFFHR